MKTKNQIQEILSFSNKKELNYLTGDSIVEIGRLRKSKRKSLRINFTNKLGWNESFINIDFKCLWDSLSEQRRKTLEREKISVFTNIGLDLFVPEDFDYGQSGYSVIATLKTKKS